MAEEAKETEFSKFIDKHKEYPACDIMSTYIRLSRQGKPMQEIFSIVEKEKIPAYKAKINEEVKRCSQMNKPSDKLYITP